MWIWALLVVVIVAVVLHDARRYRPDIQILQASVERLTPELLRERYPVVVEDGVSDPAALVRHRLPWTYRWLDAPAASAGAGWVTVPSRYMVVWNANEDRDIRVRIAHPNTAADPDPAFTEVILYPLQSVLVPVRWRVYADAALYIRAWDWTSYWLRSTSSSAAAATASAAVGATPA